MRGKTYFGIPYIFASNLTLVFAFFILAVTLFLGGANKDKIKRLSSQTANLFVNLKSNTMKTQCKGTDISENFARYSLHFIG